MRPVARAGLWLLAAIFGLLPCGVADADIAPAFTATPYGDPVVASNSEGTTIAVPSPPGGMYYRVLLDPDRTYRIHLHGQPSGGPFVLRLRENDNTPVYTQAPQGIETYRVRGTERFELLLYRDAAVDGEKYVIRNLEVEDCATTCLTDADLKQQIRADLPDLDSALNQGEYYRAALMLLRWASPRVTDANLGPGPIPSDFRSASELYYDFFRTGAGGAYCGAAADFLKKLLDLFSIPSFQLDFGDVSWFTHATVVVPVEGGEGQQYRLLDPTFDMHFTLASNGRPVSIEQMLELWRADRMDLIRAHPGDLGSRQTIVDSDASAGSLQVVRCADGSDLSNLCGLASFTRRSTPFFESHGYTADVAGILRLLGTTELVDLHYTGVPEAFRQLQARFKAAVQVGDDNVHIADLPVAPENVAPPTISGAARVGSALSIENTVWTGAQPMSHRQQWQRCSLHGDCSDIVGAADQTYVLTPDDLGHQIRAHVVASNAYGSSAGVYTEPSAAVLREPTQASEPDRPNRLVRRLSTRWLPRAKRLEVRVRARLRLWAVAKLIVRRGPYRGRRVIKPFVVSGGGAGRVRMRLPKGVGDPRQATLVLHVRGEGAVSQVLRQRLSTLRW